ncbi:MAG: hypothetical protein ACE5SW_09035 [Nitrososphaeraceae archaeon]
MKIYFIILTFLLINVNIGLLFVTDFSFGVTHDKPMYGLLQLSEDCFNGKDDDGDGLIDKDDTFDC